MTALIAAPAVAQPRTRWKERTTLEANTHSGVSLLAFSSDGKLLAAGGRDGILKLRHAASNWKPDCK